MDIIIDNPIILIDGSFYVHRAYHALPSLITSNGTPIWVVYGVINMIRNLLKRYKPTNMIVVFDTSKTTFRSDLFPQYKINRIAMPEDLYIQLNLLYEIIESMGIPILRIPYVEADDVIATLAVYYTNNSNNIVLVSTGDKDIAQIVSSKIILINTASNIIFDVNAVEKKFGVFPKLIPDYLALVGDKSDNIPGVPGIGKKIAPILLNKIGNLEDLYKNLNDIFILGIHRSTFIHKTLIENQKAALLSYQLATIKVDVPLKESNYLSTIKKINFDNLLYLFEKYEFKNWLEELKLEKWPYYNYFNNKISIIKKSLKKVHSQYELKFSNLQINSTDIIHTNIIYNVKELYRWIKNCYHTDFIVFNIYTNISNVFLDKIIGICLWINSEQHVYIPIKISTLNSNPYLKEILYILKPVLENPTVKKISQNMKFNYSFLKNYDINLSGIIFDVMLEFYILYGNFDYQNIKKFLEKDISKAILNFQQSNNNYYNSCNNTISNIQNIQLESLHAIILIRSIFDLHTVLWSKIKKNIILKKIFEDVEMPLIPVLYRIENYGVLMDKNLLNINLVELNSRLNVLKKEAYKLSNKVFNLNSPKQLQKLLFDEKKLPILKRTPNGSPSTDEEVLKILAKKYSISEVILKYRSLSKLKSTYIDKLISMVNIESHRIHTSYHQTRTSTGRLSSTNPNLQNIPNRNYDGRKIRQAFIAPENFLIVSADYSQIELRILAHLSHDIKLKSDFLSGKDIHSITASEIFVTALHLVTNEQRHFAKTINFGLIYGMSAFGLSRQLSITCKEAQKYVNRYFQRYSGVMAYMNYIKDSVNKYGYVFALNGRKLYLPGINSSKISQKKSAERAAINAPMQGSAADIIKKAMISIDHWIQQNKIPAYMIMQVHDELVFEVQYNYVDFVIKNIKRLMEESFILDVPLKVDIGVGKNWEQAH